LTIIRSEFFSVLEIETTEPKGECEYRPTSSKCGFSAPAPNASIQCLNSTTTSSDGNICNLTVLKGCRGGSFPSLCSLAFAPNAISVIAVSECLDLGLAVALFDDMISLQMNVLKLIHMKKKG
jgi:hypothetical protein